MGKPTKERQRNILLRDTYKIGVPNPSYVVPILPIVRVWHPCIHSVNHCIHHHRMMIIMIIKIDQENHQEEERNLRNKNNNNILLMYSLPVNTYLTVMDVVN